MPLDLEDYEKNARKAVKVFWAGRQSAKKKQEKNGKVDQGERASVTAGKNMDGFLEMVTAIVRANGLRNAEIHRNKKVLTLPGYFRPTKLWDMLVINEGRLVAALEFKSHVGPSFGNNFNNRTEEAIGTATDLWTAYREGAFGKIAKPFVGWLMLLEDAKGSRAPIKDASPHFPVFPEFKGASYAERYNILCQRLIQENLYTTASVLVSPREAKNSGRFSELSDMTGLQAFVTTLAGHVAAEAARIGESPRNRLIEVKSTVASPLRFYVTRNEWEQALRFGDAYHFHIWDLATNPPRLFERTVLEVSPHIPEDQANGKWATAEIPVGSVSS